MVLLSKLESCTSVGYYSLPPTPKKAVEQWEEGQEALYCFLLRPVLLNMDLCLAVSEALSTCSLELHEISGITHFTHEKSGACASITDPVIAGQDWMSLDAHQLSPRSQP